MVQPVGISERLKTFNKPLLQDKVQFKYKVMAEDAYKFYRGSCHLFYEDLSKELSFPDSPHVWACGDLHLENFGSYKANNRFVYFDQNDFDESLLAPTAWELVRMTTSIFVAFNTLKVAQKQVNEWAELHLKTYREILKGGKSKHIEARLAKGIVKSFLQSVSKRKPKELLAKHIIKKKKKHYIIIDNKKHFPLDHQLKNQLIHHLSEWIAHQGKGLQQYKVADAAFRLAGTGSLGVKRYVFLLQNKKDFLLLDMKESRPSSVRAYTKIPQPEWKTEAQREVAIQSRMEYASAALLGTTEFDECSFVIQELQPTEDKIDFASLIKRHKDISCVIEDMALLTAAAQLRSGGRQGSAIIDELIQYGEDGDWQGKIIDYACTYSKQVQADYQQFVKDYNHGYFKVGERPNAATSARL
jgi:uncharacterized protein (DUF2252 family)